MDELSNQLERLTSLPPADRKNALAELAVSEDLEAMLPTATLTANVENDENGTRIVLGLNWDRPGKPQPVTLVGWLDPTPGTPTSGTPTSGTPTSGTPTSGTPTSGTPTPGNPIPGNARNGEASQ